MNNISQFLYDTKRSLSRYDEKVNTDEFNASIKFNDLWNDTHSSLVEKYELPALHLWESGFSLGDASEREVIELADRINKIEGQGTVYAKIDEEGDIYTNAYEFLDRKLIEAINPKTETLIEEYESYCKEEMANIHPYKD